MGPFVMLAMIADVNVDVDMILSSVFWMCASV